MIAPNRNVGASMTIRLFGPFYSTYARTVRLALEEKGAPYELIMVDLLKGETKEPAHLARQPFGQVPAIEHDGHRLYETTAIVRYLDRVLPGPHLTPSDPWDAARMDQIIGIINSHAYASMVTITFVQRVITPMMGGTPDEAAVAEAQPKARLCLAEIERIMEGGPGSSAPRSASPISSCCRCSTITAQPRKVPPPSPSIRASRAGWTGSQHGPAPRPPCRGSAEQQHLDRHGGAPSYPAATFANAASKVSDPTKLRTCSGTGVASGSRGSATAAPRVCRMGSTPAQTGSA